MNHRTPSALSGRTDYAKGNLAELSVHRHRSRMSLPPPFSGILPTPFGFRFQFPPTTANEYRSRSSETMRCNLLHNDLKHFNVTSQDICLCLRSPYPKDRCLLLRGPAGPQVSSGMMVRRSVPLLVVWVLTRFASTNSRTRRSPMSYLLPVSARPPFLTAMVLTPSAWLPSQYPSRSSGLRNLPDVSRRSRSQACHTIKRANGFLTRPVALKVSPPLSPYPLRPPTNSLLRTRRRPRDGHPSLDCMRNCHQLSRGSPRPTDVFPTTPSTSQHQDIRVLHETRAPSGLDRSEDLTQTYLPSGPPLISASLITLQGTSGGHHSCEVVHQTIPSTHATTPTPQFG